LKWKQSLIAVRTIDFLVVTIGKSYDVISEARPDDVYTYYLVIDDGVEKKYTGKQIYINRSTQRTKLNNILRWK
jgi:hypothetical protein